MVIVLKPSFHSSSWRLSCSSMAKPIRKQKQRFKDRKQQLQENGNQTSLTFRKSYPTPILIQQKPLSLSKLQALDAVVSDLETSIKNGVEINDPELFASLLETCYKLKAIDQGIRIHRLVPAYLLRKNLGISSKLMRLYASCGEIETAHDMFDQMPKRDFSAFAWNSLISGYAELCQYEDALALYFQMVEEGVEPDRFTFPRVLKACTGIGSIRIGEAVHRDSVKACCGYDGFVLNALVDMYAKCGDILKARKVFDMIPYKDSVSWNTMLTAYIRHGLLFEALEIFRLMSEEERIGPDSVAISSVLACVSPVRYGFQIHGWVLRRGMEWELSIANALVVYYSKNGNLAAATWLFDRMPKKDIVSWNSIISAHSNDAKALRYFEQMGDSNFVPDAITFVSVLSACANLGFVEEGERLYVSMQRKHGINPRMEHYACMVNLYGRSGLVDKAYDFIVHEMGSEAGATVWGALLYACYVHGNVRIGEIASERLFELEPDNEHNFELLMKIYGKAKRLDDVERVRKMMLDRGLESDTAIKIWV